MTQIENFLTQDEQDKIIEAIRKAEQNTSGEIRVHIEKDPRQEVLDRATEVFEILKMENTQQRNAVLIYIAIDTRELVILGDVGINDVVPPHFWESTHQAIIKQFKEGNHTQGLVNGILTAGHQLKKHFPYKKGKANELPDDISFG